MPLWMRTCMHVSAGAVLDADDRRLGDAARPRVELLGLVLVLLQAAHVDLVHLHFPRELPLRLEGFPDPVRHVPTGLLRDAEFPVQPHRTDALQAGGVQVDGIRPILQRDLGSVHGRARADGEVAGGSRGTSRASACGSCVPWCPWSRSAGRTVPRPGKRIRTTFRRLRSSGNMAIGLAGGHARAVASAGCLLRHFAQSKKVLDDYCGCSARVIVLRW